VFQIVIKLCGKKNQCDRHASALINNDDNQSV